MILFGQLTAHLLFNLELRCQLMTTLVQYHLQLPLTGVEGIVVGIGGSGGGDASGCDGDVQERKRMVGYDKIRVRYDIYGNRTHPLNHAIAINSWSCPFVL